VFRRDPQAQERYGAKITYDLDLTRDGRSTGARVFEGFGRIS